YGSKTGVRVQFPLDWSRPPGPHPAKSGLQCVSRMVLHNEIFSPPTARGVEAHRGQAKTLAKDDAGLGSRGGNLETARTSLRAHAPGALFRGGARIPLRAGTRCRIRRAPPLRSA